jgi:hypothetical protein
VNVAYPKVPDLRRLNGERERLPAEEDPDVDLCAFDVVAASVGAVDGLIGHGHSRADPSPALAISSKRP